jgi:hypothetical protein
MNDLSKNKQIIFIPAQAQNLASRQDSHDNYFTVKKLTDTLLSSTLLTFAQK